MAARKDRVNIAVSKEVSDLLSATAEELGMTQYALANQILGVGLELIKQGYSVLQIRDIAMFYKVMIELESVPIPGRLLDRMIVEMAKEKPEVVQKVWCEAGRMLASYIKAVFGTLENASSLAPYISKVIPAKRFEIVATGDEFILDTIGVGYSIESVEATAKAAQCLLEDMGYQLKETITAPGILRIKAVKNVKTSKH
ncbi:MAG: hypothetical protein QW610_05930 [Pyrobaculum sp.]